MPAALIIYGSTTGNTESVAETIAQVLTRHDIETTVKNVVDATIEELGRAYDLTILGASTWGEDEIEFQEDFEPYYVKLQDAKQLQQKKVALFGCGDRTYEHFCGAVDQLEETIATLEAHLVNEPLRIDGDPDDANEEIRSWADEVARSIV